MRLGVGAAMVAALVVSAVVVFAIALQPRSNALPVLDDASNASGAPSPPLPTASVPPTTDGVVVVHVVGQVTAPGVYELPATARVTDAVAAAGGALPEADISAVNFARSLVDGEQIYIPAPGEQLPAVPGQQGDASGPAGEVSGPAGGASGAGLININTASATELETLPRIGPAMAQRIIDYREQHGGFESVEDLRNVTGIGDATFAGIKDLVTV